MTDHADVLIVGAGWAARRLWIPALVRAGAGVAVDDVDGAAVESCIAEFPDVVDGRRAGGRHRLAVVATPAAVRVEAAIGLLGRSDRIVLEKPPAASSGELRALAERAGAAGTELAVVSSAPYRADVAAFVAAAGSLDVRRLDARWIRCDGVPRSATFLERRLAVGGALLDLGWHLLDVLGAVLGDLTELRVVDAELRYDDPTAAGARWREDVAPDLAECDVETGGRFTASAGTTELTCESAWLGGEGPDATEFSAEGADGASVQLRCTLGYSPNREAESTLVQVDAGGRRDVRRFDNHSADSFDQQVRVLLAPDAPDDRLHGVARAASMLDVFGAAYAAAGSGAAPQHGVAR